MTSLPIAEFAFPGPLRDQLVAAVLDGSKTSTTGVVLGYTVNGESLPELGEQQIVVDSDGQHVGVIETVSVSVCRVGDVDLQHAIDEGEGYKTVADWRRGHEEFWHSEEFRADVQDPEFVVTDDTEVMVQRFKLVRPSAPAGYSTLNPADRSIPEFLWFRR